MSFTLDMVRLVLEANAADLDGREATDEDQETIRKFIGERVELAAGLVRGDLLQRPAWPGEVREAKGANIHE